MSTEDLMKPRYKVIADWPESRYVIGEILTKFFFDNGNSYLSVNNDDSEFPYRVIKTKEVEKHPHLFKPLQWWEEREEKDMPAFVKNKSGEVFSVHKIHPKENIAFIESRYISRHYEFLETLLPSTPEEYNDYLNQSK